MTETQKGQHWDPDRYKRTAGFVATLGRPVVDLLAPQPGQKILDVGCGDGALTKEVAETGAIVTGVDASPDQIGAAQAIGLDAHVMDATRLTFDAEFDGVMSNAALHWVKDQDAAMTGIARALKPGGRFACEMGGHGNIQKIGEALCNALRARDIDPASRWPWTYPTVEDQTERLIRCGFRVEQCALIPRPTPLPGHIIDWLDTFAESFFHGLDAADCAALKQTVADALSDDLCDADGIWSADYVRLRFLAVKVLDVNA